MWVDGGQLCPRRGDDYQDGLRCRSGVVAGVGPELVQSACRARTAREARGRKATKGDQGTLKEGCLRDGASGP